MEIAGIVGLVFAAATLGGWVFEREMDVLHGPYIERRVKRQSAASIWQPMVAIVEPFIESLNWKARNAIYLASLA